MPCVDCVERWRYDKVVKKCEELAEAYNHARNAYEEVRSDAMKYLEQSSKLSREIVLARAQTETFEKLFKKRDAALVETQEQARHYAEQADYYETCMTKRNAEISALRLELAQWKETAERTRACLNEFSADLAKTSKSLYASNALIQVLFLATGLSREMLKEIFGEEFQSCDRSYDERVVKRAIKHCIKTNSTIIDPIMDTAFSIAERLRRALATRNLDGTPKEAKPCDAESSKAEGKEEGAPRPTNARRRNKRKKRDARATPEQSQ